jgi:SET domain-containing protein
MILDKARLQGVLLVKADQLEVGFALDTFITLLNHSCDPNARLISEGAELRLRALKDICTGDELTISYGPEISDYSNPSDYQGRQ